MTIYLPNDIASKYKINSIIYKKDFKRGLIKYMQVTEIHYFGFKGHDSKTKFVGQVIKTEKILKKD